MRKNKLKKWMLLCLFVLLNFFSTVGLAEVRIHRDAGGSLAVNSFLGAHFRIEAQDIKVKIKDIPSLNIISASNAQVIRLNSVEGEVPKLLLLDTNIEAVKGVYSARLGTLEDPSVITTISIVVEEDDETEVGTKRSENAPPAFPSVLPNLGLSKQTYIFIFGLLILFLLLLILLKKRRDCRKEK